MLDAMIAYLWPEGLGGLTRVGEEDKVKTGQRSKDLIYQTQDGYITTGAISDKEWRALCTAIERPEWIDDERFSTPGARMRNVKTRLDMTAEVLRGKTTAEWLQRLDAEEVPCAPVLTRPEVITQEQVRANNLIFEYDHPGFGRVRQPRPAAQFDATPPATAPIAPMLGEHGREILAEHGYDDDAIDTLIASGVMAPPAEAIAP